MIVSQLEHLNINRNLLCGVGQWPYQTVRRRVFLITLYLSISVGQAVLQSGGMISAIQHDMGIFVENCATFLISLMCLVKYANCTINAVKMKELLITMQNDWNLYVNSKPELEILIKYYKLAKKLTIGYACCIYGSMVPFMVLPVLTLIQEVFTPPINETQLLRPLVFQIQYFVDTDKYYYYILIHSYLSSVALTTVVVAVDSMLLLQVQHACGIIQILGYHLENLIEDGDLDVNVNPCKRDDRSLRNIRDCVIRHKNLIEFAQSMESANTLSFLFQLGLNMICISFTGFQAVMNRDKPESAMRYASFASAQTFHLFCEIWPAQQLTDHSILLADYASHVRWYRASIATRRILNIMIMRSQRPLKLTAGKLYILNLQNFGIIIKTSFSYFTVLCSL